MDISLEHWIFSSEAPARQAIMLLGEILIIHRIEAIEDIPIQNSSWIFHLPSLVKDHKFWVEQKDWLRGHSFSTSFCVSFMKAPPHLDRDMTSKPNFRESTEMNWIYKMTLIGTLLSTLSSGYLVTPDTQRTTIIKIEIITTGFGYWNFPVHFIV